MKKKKFPAFLVILLLFAITWFINELGYLTINIPWLPVILLVFVVGAIINHYQS